MKRALAILLTALLVLGILAGCNKTPTTTTTTKKDDNKTTTTTQKPPEDPDAWKYGGTMVTGVTGGVNQPMYIFESSMLDGHLRDLSMEKLFTWDVDHNIIPRLALSYEAENNNTKFTVHLREGVKWPDGEPFTSKDILCYWDVLERANSTEIISRPSEDYPGFKVSAPDDYTIVYEVDDPLVTFVYSGLCSFCALPYHIWKDANLEKVDEITDVKYLMGLGPFTITEIRPSEEVKLVRNEYYWEMKPYLDGVLVRVVPDVDALRLAFENGEVNYLMQGASYDLMEKLDGQEGFHFDTMPSGNFSYYIMNLEDEVLKNVEVRHALNLLANRDAIKVADRKPMSQIMTSVFTSFDLVYQPNTMNEDCYTYNPEKAIKILEDAGWKVGADGIREKDGVKLKITQLALSDATPAHLIFMEDCKKAGIEITIKIVDRATVISTIFVANPTDYQMFQNGSTLGPTSGGYGTFFGSGNFTNYDSAELRDMFDQAEHASSMEEMISKCNEISKVVSDNFAFVWLFENTRFEETSNYLNLQECELCGWNHGWISIAHAYFEQ